jgi:AcrR family transcriptional regulator
VSSTVETSDGRRARRERNRVAVIDAVFELLREGHVPPSVEQVAERAEVSVSSVFRYFDDLDDMHQQTVRRYFERYAPLFEVPDRADGTLGDRVAALVDARLELYETIGPIARMARARASAHPAMAETLHATRQRFARQVASHLALDLEGRDDAADVVDLVDALTSFEAWDLLRSTHGRSRAAIRRAWLAGVTALVS